MHTRAPLILAVCVALARPAIGQAQSAAGRLDRASSLSQSGAGAVSLEQARALSSTALDASPKLDSAVVDASGASAAPAANRQTPTLTVSPARPAAIHVPGPARPSSRDDRGKHAGAFMVAGVLAPLVGAAAGALLGGGPGAVAGALIGTAVGLVLLGIGLTRLLGHVFNP